MRAIAKSEKYMLQHKNVVAGKNLPYGLHNIRPHLEKNAKMLKIGWGITMFLAYKNAEIFWKYIQNAVNQSFLKI